MKRENLATATVIVPAVKKNAAALNKIELFHEPSSPTFVGFFICGMMCRFGDGY